jgi:putative FmdB family regulatory protein
MLSEVTAMPIYEYFCEKCGSHIEVLQKVSDAPLKRCQKCRGKLEKLVSRTSFQLKGGGWYVSDYSSKPSSSSKSDSSEKKGESAASTDTK